MTTDPEQFRADADAGMTKAFNYERVRRAIAQEFTDLTAVLYDLTDDEFARRLREAFS